MNKEEFHKQLLENHLASKDIPSVYVVREFYQKLLVWLYPEFCEKNFSSIQEIIQEEEELRHRLRKMLEKLPTSAEAESLVEAFFKTIPELYSTLKKDLKAMLEGDPAATSESEIIRSYPGFYAIIAYRIAHLIRILQIPILPRMITEFAHEKTGIDINPGALIGEYFCIDHGTGVVIGETSIIGNNVKIYQGVTLGALSVRKEDAKSKRHPTLEDNVVVYAGATILGGTTIIGKNSIIGGNVWITKSVPSDSKVYYQTKMFDDNQIEDDSNISENKYHS